MRKMKIHSVHSIEPATFRVVKHATAFGLMVGSIFSTKTAGLALATARRTEPSLAVPHTTTGESIGWVAIDHFEPTDEAARKLMAALIQLERLHGRCDVKLVDEEDVTTRQRLKRDSQNVVKLHRELAETKHYAKDMRDSLDAIKVERDAAQSALRKTQEAMAQMRTDWAGDRQFLIDEDVALHKELMLAENRANAAHRRAQRAEGAYTRLAKRYDKLASRITSAFSSPRAPMESALNLIDALGNALGMPAGNCRGPVSGPTFDVLKTAIGEALERWLSLAHFAQPLEPIDLGPKPHADRPIPYKMTTKFDTETQKWNLKKTAGDGIMLLGDFIGSEPRTLKVDVAEMSKKLGELFGSLKKPTNAESK